MSETLNITRLRSETRPETVQLRDPESEELLDLTGSLIRMSINTVEDPVKTDPPEFEMIGTVSATPTDGLATFEPTPTDADRVGLYYCDIRVTLASGILVYPAKGTWSFEENVTKAAFGEQWEPSPAIADGTEHPFDASGFWLLSSTRSNISATYETQGTTKVLRLTGTNATPVSFYLCACGDLAKQYFLGPSGKYRYDLLIWPGNEVIFSIGNYEIKASPASAHCRLDFFSADSVIFVEAESGKDEIEQSATTPMSGIVYNSWIRIAVEIDFEAHTIKAKAWNDGETEPAAWIVETAGVAIASLGVQQIVLAPLIALDKYIDLAYFAWRRIY